MGNVGGLINSIIGGASNAVGNTGASIFGNQAVQARLGGVGREQAMSQGLWNTPLSKFGKQAKETLWDLIMEQLASQREANTQVINPELTSGMYNFFTRDLTRNYNQARKGAEQGMVNRGMDYGNVMTKNLSQVDTDYRNQLADIGSKLAYDAAKTNYGAEQQRWQNLSSLMPLLANLYSGERGRQQTYKMQGLQGLYDANSALANVQSDKWKMWNDIFQNWNSGAAQSGQDFVTAWFGGK